MKRLISPNAIRGLRLQPAQGLEVGGSSDQRRGILHQGETIAQEQTEFKIYKGMIELRVRFRSKRVSGLIRGLMDGDGKMYSRNSDGDVDSIILPTATMNNTAGWTPRRPGQTTLLSSSYPGRVVAAPDSSGRQFQGSDRRRGRECWRCGDRHLGAHGHARRRQGTAVVHDKPGTS